MTIRLRLALAFTLLVGLILLLTGAVTYQLVRHSLLTEIQQDVVRRAESFSLTRSPVPAPVEPGRPVTVTAGGQRIVVRTWRLGGTEAVVAVSGRPFPMPATATAIAGLVTMLAAELRAQSRAS